MSVKGARTIVLVWNSIPNLNIAFQSNTLKISTVHQAVLGTSVLTRLPLEKMAAIS